MSFWQPILVVLLVVFAISLRFSKILRGYQFTAWIVAAVTAAMIYPSAFTNWGSVNLRDKWIILVVVQAVMFGMGTQMSLRDFAGVAKSPRGVLIGILCHFTVMPLVGLALVKTFHFEPEIAAGVILIGSCSSGLASNVMAYIAKSNLPLSVTVTAITTMIAPIMTPFWMKMLANQYVPVSYFNMMMEIIKIVLVPIGAALIHDYLKRFDFAPDTVCVSLSPQRGEGQGERCESRQSSDNSSPSPHLTPTLSPPLQGAEREESNSTRGRIIVYAITAFGAVWLAFLASGGWGFLKAHCAEEALPVISIAGFLLSAFVIGTVYHWFTRWFTRLDSWMPVLSMAGIVYFTTVTTAAGRDNLLKVGSLLFLAAALHNAAGYFFGYWLSRGAGLDKNSARSIAFEVGLQNGGMASGLAGVMGKLGTVGLAAAIFSPWMNVSGSVLANYWRKRPVKDNQPQRTQRTQR